jgi:hypothetical protein
VREFCTRDLITLKRFWSLRFFSACRSLENKKDLKCEKINENTERSITENSCEISVDKKHTTNQNSQTNTHSPQLIDLSDLTFSFAHHPHLYSYAHLEVLLLPFSVKGELKECHHKQVELLTHHLTHHPSSKKKEFIWAKITFSLFFCCFEN